MRQVSKQRNTRETKIQLTINLDGSGKVAVRSGIGYLDHMLEQLAFHGLFDLELQCEGDLVKPCSCSSMIAAGTGSMSSIIAEAPGPKASGSAGCGKGSGAATRLFFVLANTIASGLALIG